MRLELWSARGSDGGEGVAAVDLEGEASWFLEEEGDGEVGGGVVGREEVRRHTRYITLFSTPSCWRIAG